MEAAATCFGLQRNHHQGATVYAHTVHKTHTTQVILCRHNTDNVCTTSVSTLNQTCILAKYWLWVPDGGFFVNQNMLEQPL